MSSRMMSLISLINAAGLTVRLSDTPMEYRLLVAPASLLTPALRDRITAHRDELVDTLYADRRDAWFPPIDPDALGRLSARLRATDDELAGRLAVTS